MRESVHVSKLINFIIMLNKHTYMSQAQVINVCYLLVEVHNTKPGVYTCIPLEIH